MKHSRHAFNESASCRNESVGGERKEGGMGRGEGLNKTIKLFRKKLVLSLEGQYCFYFSRDSRRFPALPGKETALFLSFLLFRLASTKCETRRVLDREQ